VNTTGRCATLQSNGSDICIHIRRFPSPENIVTPFVRNGQYCVYLLTKEYYNILSHWYCVPFRQKYSIPYHPNQKSSRCKDERHCHLLFGVIDGGYRSDWIVSDVCKWNTVESGLDYSFSDYRWVKVQARVTLWLSLTYQHNFGRMLGWMSYVGIMRTSLPLFLRRHQQPYLFASGWF
jgi:hypothetical protein